MALQTQIFQLPRPPALPDDAELARRRLTFERVHEEFQSPVRLRQNGEAVGIFPTRIAAACLIKLLPVIVVLLCIAPSLHAGARASDTAGLLLGIATVENWQGHPGKFGEVGPFQMLPGTRADRLREFVSRGETSPGERMLAGAQVEWIRRELRHRGAAVVPFNIALCWNAGVDRALSGRAPVSSYDYARRVVAVMEGSK